ncbi:MAG: TerC family protein [Bacteroidota bacterium]
MLENLFTLFMLIMLQAVLGFDNLLYISLESKRAPEEKQAQVRNLGIGIAIVLRIGLLFLLLQLLPLFEEPFFHIHWEGVVEGAITGHSLIVLFGGGFILYTAVKEIWHMVYLDEHAKEKKEKSSFGKVLFLIVIMNLVFSFDSILSAIALTKVLWVMATAIVISGGLMIWLSDRVSKFLARNRMFEVLGLFILFLVGVMLISEGGHLAELAFFDVHITPMSKSTFYFVIFVLVVVDIVQGRYQKKLVKQYEESKQ